MSHELFNSSSRRGTSHGLTAIPRLSTLGYGRRVMGLVGATGLTEVVDGDTIKVADGSIVRVDGIDAPETMSPTAPVGCFNPEASAWAHGILMGKESS